MSVYFRYCRKNSKKVLWLCLPLTSNFACISSVRLETTDNGALTISVNLPLTSSPVESVSFIAQILIPNGVMPKKITELQLTEAQIEMVKAGYGVKVISKWAVEPYLKTQPIVSLPVTKNGFKRTWYLVMLKQENQPDFYTSFKDRLIEQMRSVVGC